MVMEDYLQERPSANEGRRRKRKGWVMLGGYAIPAVTKCVCVWWVWVWLDVVDALSSSAPFHVEQMRSKNQARIYS